MFRANNQPALITFETELSKTQRDKLNHTKESYFYELIFNNIREADFKPLFSKKYSRPNAPVNIMVASLIYKETKGLSYDELMESMLFDLRIKKALGISNLDEIPFARASLFNFQNRVSAYNIETGINLFEKVFDNLTISQLKKLKIKTDIQRTDSLLISTNIARLSRVRLLIEILLRLNRMIDEDDELKKEIVEILSSYIKKGSEKYIYDIKPGDLPHELSKLGEIYYQISQLLSGKEKYFENKEYRNFIRVYEEQFVIVNGLAEPKRNEELNSGMLQSPDDPEATYRKKKDKESIGYTINATETANPDNPIQLINDVAVTPNNVDDSKILEERIDKIVEKTPDLKEMHTDGGYGSEANDEKFEEMEITQVTTAIKGRQSGVDIKIEQTNQSPDTYTVECPYQKATSQPTKQRFKVCFDREQCTQCPLGDNCRIFKNKGRHYFGHNDYLKYKRNDNIKRIPSERRKIRPNVEATMKEMRGKTNGGKLKIRGLFKTAMYSLNRAIGINFGRIYRYIIDNVAINPIEPNNAQDMPLAMVYPGLFLTRLFDTAVWMIAKSKCKIQQLIGKIFSHPQNTPFWEGLNLGAF